MNTIDEFVALLHDEVGLPVSADDVETGLDQVPGWDSVHLLTLMMALERRTGRTIPMPELLEAPSLGHIYRLASA
ncbi:acyl carrier protein [Umezawaea tangerina]|uniref:Acyl carrier protein n=1 Tax=Umezawaea tangerina TaxID=84725 RepID=A0A2T0SN88_9PSEU|nr:acyl carrier protein [Umezawaea tangerina]PRY34874.1 acyl carrier protein [Umezawaea tangerina]